MGKLTNVTEKEKKAPQAKPTATASKSASNNVVNDWVSSYASARQNTPSYQREQEKRQQPAEPIHRHKVWTDSNGNVNISDLTSGNTTRYYQNHFLKPKTEAELARNQKESFGLDTMQAMSSAIRGQGAGVQSLLATGGLALGGLLHGDNNYKPEVGSWLWRLQEGAEATTDSANRLQMDAQSGRNELGRRTMQFINAGTAFGFQRALDAVLPGSGSALMYASAGGSAAEEARQQGKSISTQVLKGAKSAAIAWATENLSKVSGLPGKTGEGLIDDYINKATQAIANKGGNAVLFRIASSMASEGAEEVIEDYFNYWGDKFLAKVAKGDYTVDELPDAIEIFYDGLIGGLLGGFGGAVQASVDTRRAKANGVSYSQQIQNDYDAKRERFETEKILKRAKRGKNFERLTNMINGANKYVDGVLTSVDAEKAEKKAAAASAPVAPVEAAPDVAPPSTPAAPEASEKAAPVEFNATPDVKPGQLTREQAIDRIAQLERQAEVQQKAADSIAYAPSKQVYQQEADKLRQQAERLRQQYGIEAGQSAFEPDTPAAAEPDQYAALRDIAEEPAAMPAAERVENPKRSRPSARDTAWSAWFTDNAAPEARGVDVESSDFNDEASTISPESGTIKPETTGKRPESVQRIIDTLESGGDVDIDELISTPEVAKARIEQRNRTGEPLTDEEIESAAAEGVRRGNVSDGAYNGEIAREKKAEIVLGLPGSGKSSIFSDKLSNELHARIIDTDDFRDLVPDYNGVNANATHGDAQKIRRRIFAQAVANHENVVFSTVGNSEESIKDTIALLKGEGYTVNLRFVDLPANKAIGRALKRFFKEDGTTGRFIDPELIRAYGDTPKQVYEKLIGEKGLVDGYSSYSNDVKEGQKAILLTSSDSEGTSGNVLGRERGEAPERDAGKDKEGRAENPVSKKTGADVLAEAAKKKGKAPRKKRTSKAKKAEKSGAEVLAEAAKKEAEPEKEKSSREKTLDTLVSEIKNTKDSNKKAKEIAHNYVKLAVLKSAGFKVAEDKAPDGAQPYSVIDDPRVKYPTQSSRSRAKLEQKELSKSGVLRYKNGYVGEGNAAQEYESRQEYIGDRGISAKDRLQYAKDMDKIDFLDAVDDFVDKFIANHTEGGVFQAKDIRSLDTELRKFVDNYQAAHDYTYDIVDGEIKKHYYGVKQGSAMSDVIKDIEDADMREQLKQEGFANRTLHKLTYDLTEEQISDIVEKNINPKEKPEKMNFKVVPEGGAGSPYTVYYAYNKKSKGEPYTVRIMHTDANAENGVRIVKFKASSKKEIGKTVADFISKYEKGDVFAKEAFYKETRRQMLNELVKQKGDKTDYMGHYESGDFAVDISKRKGRNGIVYDITVSLGGKEIDSDSFKDDWMVNEKGERDESYNPLQKAATMLEDANFEVGEKHLFDLLNPETAADLFIKLNKGTSTVLMPGYKEQTIYVGFGKDGKLEEKKVMVPGFTATKSANTAEGTMQQAADAMKKAGLAKDDLPIRRTILDKAFDPDVVEVDGVLYDVSVGYASEYTYKNGNATSNTMKYFITYHDGSNNLEADVNIKNASTPEEAVEYAKKKNLFRDYGSDLSIKEHQKREAAKIAKERNENESKAEIEQSGNPDGQEGAEAGAGGRDNVDGVRQQGSDGGRPDGAVVGRSVRSLRDVSRKETRVVQGYDEKQASDVINNITRGRTKTRVAMLGDAISRELGLTTAEKNERGKTRGEVILSDKIPDGSIARRGVGGHEGTHAELVNKFGDDWRAAAVSAWQTFKGLHPEEASKMEAYIMLKENYVGDYVKTEYDSLPKDVKETAADEIIAHWAGGTIRTTGPEGAEAATKCQLMLQEFLVKELGFSPNAYSRRVAKDIHGNELVSGACLISEWYTIQDEIREYSRLVQASLGDTEAKQESGALDVSSEQAEFDRMRAEEQGGKVRDVKNEKYERQRQQDKTEVNNSEQYAREEGKRKAEEKARNAEKNLEEAQRFFGKDYDRVKEANKSFSENKTFLDSEDFRKSDSRRDKNAAKELDDFRTLFNGVVDGSENIDDLMYAYERFARSPVLAEFYNEDVKRDIDNLREMLDQRSPRYNEGAAPYEAARLMQKMAHKIQQANEWHEAGKKLNETITGKGGRLAKKLAKSDKFAATVARALYRWQINPDTVFKMLDGFDKSGDGEGYKLSQELRDSVTKHYDVLVKARSHFDKLSSEKGFNEFAFGKQKVKDHTGREWDARDAADFLNKAESLMSTSGKKLGGTDGVVIVSADGKKEFIDFNDAEANKLYDSLKANLGELAAKYRNAAIDSYEEVKDPLREKYRENNGYEIGMIGDDNETFKKYGLDRAVYSPTAYMTKDGKSFEWNVADSMANNGTPGILRSRTDNGGAYLVIRPITETVDRYFEQASNYLAYSTFADKMAFLARGSEARPGLNQMMTENYGKDMGNWLTNYVEDISSFKNDTDTEGINSLLREGRQKLQSGALLFSVSVPIKQISSYWAAAALLHPDSLAANYRVKLLKAKNAPSDNVHLASRLLGNIDQSAAEAMKDSKSLVGKLKQKSPIIRKMADAISQMDYNTVSNLYSAVEYEVLKYQFNGDKSKVETQEYKDAVEKLFQEVVLRSQPVFDKQMRAEYGRTDNEIVRMLSMFRTQQTQNFNLIATALGEYAAAKGTAGEAAAAKTLKNTMSGQVASAMSLAALTILADLVLHRHRKYEEKDEESGEYELSGSKLAQRFFMNAAAASAGTAWFGDSVAKWAIDQLSGGKTKEFYGVNMGVVSEISDIIESVGKVIQTPTRSNARYAAGYIATAMGIPLNNAYYLLNAAVMYARDAAGESGDYDDILKYLDAEEKAAKKAEEKAAKAEAKAAEKAEKQNGADMLADTAKQNSSQSELNSAEEQKEPEVSTYLKRPYKALVDAGMSPERSQYVLDFIDTDDNSSIKQAEMLAFYRDNPDYEDYVIAMWNSYGYKTSWEDYKKKKKVK